MPRRSSSFHTANQAAALLVMVAFGTTSCAVIGDTFVSPHKNSKRSKGSKSRLEFNPNLDANNYTAHGAALCWTSTTSVKSLAGLAEPAIALLIGLAAKGVEKESKRYSTTYSQRKSDVLYVVGGGGATLNAKELYFTRSVGSEKQFEFLARMNLVGDAAIQLEPLMFRMTKSKAKVAGVRWWSFLWMWVLYPWQAADEKIGSVDVNVQVQLDGVITGAKERTVKTLGTVDFPLGRFKMRKKQLCQKEMEYLVSPYIALPKITGSGPVPGTVTVTVMESNDMGDVIAKGAAQISENQDDWAKKLAMKISGQ